MITGAICLLASAAFSVFMLISSRERVGCELAEMAANAAVLEDHGDEESAASIRDLAAAMRKMRRTLWLFVGLLPVLAVLIIAVAVLRPA